MLYLGVGSRNPKIFKALKQKKIGLMDSPNNWEKKDHGIIWAGDNGCFGDKFNLKIWSAWLERSLPYIDDCMFATVPDMLCDHKKTLKMFNQYYNIPKSLGYPIAFVAQNGSTPNNIPWDDIDVLFIGGDTDWKMGKKAIAVTDRAKENGKKVHVGRVNSYRRYYYWHQAGADSADGSTFAFAPEQRLAEVLTWPDLIQSGPDIYKRLSVCVCGKSYDSVYGLNGHKRVCRL